MITGFNTNVRRRGRTFHVQTEDSGRGNPRIVSHLYFGGTILATEKQDYARHLEDEDLDIRVRALMEGQHKALLARLDRGELDALIDERLGAASGASAAPTPGEPSTEAPAPPAAPPGGDSAPALGGDTAPSMSDGTPAPTLPPEPAPARSFGSRDESEKPLDEVILEYLVEKARKRPGAAGPGARASRSKG